MTEYKVEPIFNYSTPELSDRKIGEKMDAIINYKVIERTRGVTIVRILHLLIKPRTRRVS